MSWKSWVCFSEFQCFKLRQELHSFEARGFVYDTLQVILTFKDMATQSLHKKSPRLEARRRNMKVQMDFGNFPWLCWWETWCFHSCLLPPPNKVCLCGELSKIDCCDVFHPGRAIYKTLWNNIRSNKDCTKKHLPYDREAFSMFPMFPVFSSARLSFTAENTDDLTQTSQGRKGLMNAIKGECFFWKVLSFCVSESFQQGLKDQMHALATNWRSYCGSDCVMKMQLPRLISGRTAPSRSNRCFLAQIRQAFHVLTS